MSNFQRGRSAGLSGTIGTPADTASKIPVEIYWWKRREQAEFKGRFGPTTNGEISYRFINKVRNGMASGQIVGKAPEPSDWEGQTTTLVTQYAADKTITRTIIITKFEVEFPVKEHDLWDVTIEFNVTGEPTYSDGWGDQSTLGAVTKEDAELYEGSGTTIDPATVPLQGTDEDVFDWWGDLTADNKTYVLAKLVAVVTAATPLTGFKKRPSTINQDAPDGGVITIRYGLTDTNDDAELPTRIVKSDVNAVENAAQEGILYATGDTVPTISDLTITPPTDTKLATTTIKELNDGARMAVLDLQLNTPKEFITRRQSRNTQEAAHLENGSIVVEFTTSATSDPSGKNPDATNLEYDKSMSFRWSDTQYLHTHEFNPLSPKHRVEEDAYRNDTDPGTIPLVDEQVRCVEDGTAGNGTPPTISGLVCVRAYTKKRGITAFAHYYFYSFRSNADKMIAGRVRVSIDPSGLASNSVSGEIYTGSAPGLPTLANFELFDYEDLPTPNPSYTLRIYIWQLLTRAQEIEHRGTKARRQYFQPASGTVFTQTTFKTCIITDTAETLLATEVTTIEAVTSRPYFAIEVEKLNKLRYVLRVERPNDDKAIEIVSGHTREEGYSVDSSGLYVKVVDADPTAGSDGLFKYVLGNFVYWVYREEIRLRRYYRADNITDVDQHAILGQRHSNSSPFLTWGQYKIMYDSRRIAADWAAEGGNRWLAIDFFFLTSTIGFYESSGIPIGAVLKNSSAVTQGTTPLISSLDDLPGAPTTTPTNAGDFNSAFLS